MNKRNIHTLALKALQEAVYDVILEHKKTGRPLSIWRNGKVVKISATAALQQYRNEHTPVKKMKEARGFLKGIDTSVKREKGR